MLLATTVIDLTGLHSRIVHRPRPENDPRQRPDISRAQNLLDWKHALCLETAWYAPSHISISYCPTRNCVRSSLRSRQLEQSCNFGIDSFASSARVGYTTALQLYRLAPHA
jgi:hypothetical protein